MHIITRLCALCLLKTIIHIILFEMYYDNYMFPNKLYALCTLFRDYVHYMFYLLLYELSDSKAIIRIIVTLIYYTHYCNYCNKINTIMCIICIIKIIYLYPYTHIKVVYGFRLWVSQPECICINARQL